MIVELAVLDNYGIITALRNSKTSSPIFAPKKRSEKPQFLHDVG